MSFNALALGVAPGEAVVAAFWEAVTSAGVRVEEEAVSTLSVVMAGLAQAAASIPLGTAWAFVDNNDVAIDFLVGWRHS